MNIFELPTGKRHVINLSNGLRISAKATNELSVTGQGLLSRKFIAAVTSKGGINEIFWLVANDLIDFESIRGYINALDNKGSTKRG